ncbi:MAG: hypothetical protein ACJ76S_06285 [Solirubrobacteraceae bacterium]|jgi:hypothetical protein
MPDKQPEEDSSFSREELEQLSGEKLPPRTAMSLVNANLAADVDATVAANMLSDDVLPEADPD